MPMFVPINDLCVTHEKAKLHREIDPRAERNYIVFEDEQCRRQCAECHDKENHLPFNRRTASDSLIAKL